MAITKARMTEDDFLRLPDNGRKYELVDGEPREVPTTIQHDAIGANVVLLIGPFVRGRGILTIAQAGFRMMNGNIRIPDVAYTRKERLPGGKPPDTFADFAPDLAIEIVSLSEEVSEREQKLSEYLFSGVQQVWYLFPETQQVAVYTSPGDRKLYAPEEELEGGNLLPGFRCKVSELFDVGL